MLELSFNHAEVAVTIGKLVPEHQRSFVLSALEQHDQSEAEYDRLGTMLTGEQENTSFLLMTGAGRTKGPSLWAAIKVELYELFCTKSRKYSSVRKKGAASIENTIKVVATAVAASFNLALGVVVGAVTIALICLLKVGSHAWCAVHQPTNVSIP